MTEAALQQKAAGDGLPYCSSFCTTHCPHRARQGCTSQEIRAVPHVSKCYNYTALERAAALSTRNLSNGQQKNGALERKWTISCFSHVQKQYSLLLWYLWYSLDWEATVLRKTHSCGEVWVTELGTPGKKSASLLRTVHGSYTVPFVGRRDLPAFAQRQEGETVLTS